MISPASPTSNSNFSSLPRSLRQVPVTAVLREMQRRGLAIPGVTPAASAVAPFPDWLVQTNRVAAWSWDRPYQRHLYAHLDRLTRREIDRLVLSLPPRHMKSETVTIRYVAWRLIRDPGLRVVIGCYSADLAKRFSRAIRRLVRESGIPMNPEAQDVCQWETAAGGGLRAAGVGGGITGMGFDLLVVDDPVKSQAEADSAAYRDRVYEWFSVDLLTRCEPGAAMVLIMTRWHEDDLAGRLLATEAAAEWAVINLPALAEANDPLGRDYGVALCPDRYDEAALLRIQRTMGSQRFWALYQGRPTARGGDVLKRQWWRFWYPAGSPPPPPVRVLLDDGADYTCPQVACPLTFTHQLQSWDSNFGDDTSNQEHGDFVVGQVWGQNESECFLLDQTRGRWGFAETLPKVLSLSSAWPKAHLKLIEKSANGPAIISMLRKRVTGLVAQGTGRMSKTGRAEAASALVEAGNVYLPHPACFPWVHELLDECSAFPRGAHDDQVDALAQALNRLAHPTDFGFADDRTPDEIENDAWNALRRRRLGEDDDE